MKTVILVWPMLALAFLADGCLTSKPKPVAWNLSVAKTTPAAIEVDVIGIPSDDRGVWEGYDIDKYWRSGDLRRANADKISTDLPTGTVWTVPRTDPHWNRWLDRGATHLLIIANLPGKNFSSPDPRRKFISLDKHDWDADHDTLQVEVQDDMVRVITKPKLKKGR